MRKISIAFSSCPNDTFMMYALVHKKIDLHNFIFEHSIYDIDKLNTYAINGKYDITKVSAALIPFIQNYHILKSGAAFSIDGGPLLISKKDKKAENIVTIALPGEHTSAHALFNAFYLKNCQKKFVLFSDIFKTLSENEADAGVIIHEDRFVYHEKGFTEIMDLGRKWYDTYNLPVPLGLFLCRNTFSDDEIFQFRSLIRESIRYARNNYHEVFQWVKELAANIETDVINEHIWFYVNSFSENIEDLSLKSLEQLYFILGKSLHLHSTENYIIVTQE